MKLEKLKARIVSSDYVVDADAVAEAIVRRLLSSRCEPGFGAANAGGAGPIGAGPAGDAS